MALKLSNNGVGFLAAALAADGTTIAIQPGQGEMFPTLAAGDWCPGTLVNDAGHIEIVRITARSNDTFTVQRAQEGTQAVPFNAGDRFEHRLTAGAIASIVADVLARLPIAGGTITGDLTVNGALNAGTLKRSGNAVWDAGNFNPAAKLDLAGGTMTGKLTGATLGMSMTQDSGATQGSYVCRATGTGDANLAGMTFYNDAYAVKLGVRADGYFGLGGWSRAAWSWYSDPSGNMVAAGNVTAYSDPRLKDDVERIGGALAIIEQLDGVRFTWNGRTKLIGRPGTRDIGVLADQVEAVLPELVSRSVPDEENGGEQWRVVAYDKLVPVLIEAVKELAGRVRALEV